MLMLQPCLCSNIILIIFMYSELCDMHFRLSFDCLTNLYFSCCNKLVPLSLWNLILKGCI